jgi:hypothetical protein
MSGQQAYHKRRVEFVSHQAMVSWYMGSHLVGSSRTSKRRNRCANARYSSQYARLRNISISSLTPKGSGHSPYAKATAWSFRENNKPTLQSFGSWLKPPVRKKLVRSSKHLFRKRHEKGALAHDCLLITSGITRRQMGMKHGPLRESQRRKSRHQMAALRVEGQRVSAQRCATFL